MQYKGCKPVDVTTAPFSGAVPQSLALGTKGEQREGSVCLPHAHNIAAEVLPVAVLRTLFHCGYSPCWGNKFLSQFAHVAQILRKFQTSQCSFSCWDPRHWIFLSLIQPASHPTLGPFEKLSLTVSLWEMLLQGKIVMLHCIKQGSFIIRRGDDFAASSCWLVANKNGCSWPSGGNCVHHKHKCRQQNRYSAFSMFSQSG